MNPKIMTGTLADFFHSVKETAREIDTTYPLTHKHILWMETEDLVELLRPRRVRLVNYLKGKSQVTLLDLTQAMQRSSREVNRDLAILAQFQLVKIHNSTGVQCDLDRVVEPLFDKEGFELRVKM